MQLEIWADVVCPWCLIGKRRLEHALADFDRRDEIEIVPRSFQLDPRASAGSGLTTAQVLATKYGRTADQVAVMFADVEALADAEGLEYHLATAPYGNTFDVHRVLHLAAQQGLANAAWERLYRAYFTQNLPVFEPDVLVSLVAEAGVDADEARAVLGSDRYAAAVHDEVRTATELGATGVPFFVADRRVGMAGAQSVAYMTRFLQQATQSD